MALVIIFHNDSTSKDAENLGNYTVQVQINQKVIASGRVEGFPRKLGWRALVRRYLDDIEAPL